MLSFPAQRRAAARRKLIILLAGLLLCLGHQPCLQGQTRAAAAIPAAPARVSAKAVVLREEERSLAQQLIAEARTQPSLGQRLKIISARLLGFPYITQPLAGSPSAPEQLVARLDGFDCVTYLETVLALAGARNVDEYLTRLREIRYEQGEVAWDKRLHYMTDWLTVNVERSFLADLTQGAGLVERRVALSYLKGITPHEAQLRYFPKQELAAVKPWLADGDLIFFVSQRRSLDIYHVGMLFRLGDRIVMRHATRNRGRVAEHELGGFVKLSHTAGFLIARPLR
jgi:hypothetical protein